MSLDALAEAPAPDTTPAMPDSAPAPTPEIKADKPDPQIAEKALDDDLRKAFRNANRNRAEDGRFAAKDAANDDPEITPPKSKLATLAPQDKAAADKSVTSKVQTPEVKASEPARESQPPAIAAPTSWTSEMKAKWADLPSEAQSYIAQRERAAHDQISKLGEAVKAYEPFGEAANQYIDYFRQIGMHPAAFLAKATETSRSLDRDPVGTIRELMNAYKVDPWSFLDTSAPAQSDPAVSRMQARIDDLERQLSGFTSQQEQAANAQMQQTLNSVMEEISGFAQDKADWSELQADILHSVAAIREQKPNASNKEVLAEAYERAQWANPTIRAKLIAEQAKAAEAKRIEEAKKVATSARQAQSINVNGAHRASAPPSSMDDDLRAIFRRNHAR